MQAVVCYTYHTHRVEIVSVVLVTDLWFFHRYRFHFVTIALFRTEPKKKGEICHLSDVDDEVHG